MNLKANSEGFWLQRICLSVNEYSPMLLVEKWHRALAPFYTMLLDEFVPHLLISIEACGDIDHINILHECVRSILCKF